MKRKAFLLMAVIVLAVLAIMLVVQPGWWSVSAQAAQQPPQFLPQSSTGVQTVAQVSSLPYTTAVEALYGGGDDPDSLDPALDYETAGSHVIQQVYESLVTLNREHTDQVVPQLSTGWTTSPDGKTYTFTLPSGVHFHNGAALMAQDVAFSYWRGILLGDTNTPQYLMDEAVFNIDDVTQLVDPSGSLIGNPSALQAQPAGVLQAACITVTQAITYNNAAGTVTFNLVHPWGAFLQTLAGPWGAVMSKPWLIANGPWDGSCATWQNAYGTVAHTSPIASVTNGTGPYMLDHWTPSVEIVLKRNPNYWRQTPIWPGGPSGLAAIEQVKILEVPDSATSDGMLFNGSADLVPFAASDAITANNSVLLNYYQPDGLVGSLQYLTGTLRAYRNILQNLAFDAFFVYDIAPGGSINYIGSGALDGNGVPADFFSDIHVRKGFSYAFNWPQYISDVYGGDAIQRRGPFIKGIDGYTDTQPAYFYSPTLAMQEFAQAWGGQVISHGFVITLSYYTGNIGPQYLAQNLKAGLEALTNTFHVNVIAIPYSSYSSDERNSQMPIFRAGWQQDIPYPNNWVVPYFETIYAGRQQLPADQKAIYAAKNNACMVLSGSAAETCWEDIQNTAYLSATDIFLAQGTYPQYARGELRGYYANPTGFGQYYYALSKGPLPVIGSASPGIDSSTNFTTSTGATATLLLPTGSVTQTTNIVVVPDEIAQGAPSGFQFGNMAFDLQAYVSNTLITSQTFSSPITLTLHYNTASKGVLIENQLTLFWWNGNAWVDGACGPYVRDLINHVLQVPICHFSEFALGGVTNKIYLPLIRR